jgi:hypothetical protein
VCVITADATNLPLVEAFALIELHRREDRILGEGRRDSGGARHFLAAGPSVRMKTPADRDVVFGWVLSAAWLCG